MAKKPYSQKISDILLKYGMIEEEALRSAEQEAQTSGTRLEKVLIDKKMVKSEDMTLALSEYLKMPPIILSHFTPSQMILDLIPKDVMAKRLIIPIAQVGKTLTMALGDPFDVVAIDEIGTSTGLRITPLIASEKDIKDTLERLGADQQDTMDMSEMLKDGCRDRKGGKRRRRKSGNDDSGRTGSTGHQNGQYDAP